MNCGLTPEDCGKNASGSEAWEPFGTVKELAISQIELTPTQTSSLSRFRKPKVLERI
jgi:hypothetical protein